MNPPPIHPDDEGTFQRAHTLAFWLAKKEGLVLYTVEPKRRPTAGCALGLCYYEVDRRIAITLRYRNAKEDGGKWWRKPFPWDEIAETVAHEVAHLKHPNHSPAFRRYEKKLIAMIPEFELAH